MTFARIATAMMGLVLPFVLATAASAYPLLGPPDTAPAEKLSQIKSIGIIFDPGEPLWLSKIGTTAFTNTRDKLSIQDWQLDKFVLATVSHSLDPKFTAGPSDLDPLTVSKLKESFFNSYDKQLRALIAKTPDKKFDAYLNFRFYDSYQDPIGGTNQTLHGMGLYHHNFFDRTTDAEYAFVAMDLVDAKTGDRIAGGTLCFQTPDGKCEHRDWQPSKPEYWVESPDALGQDQKNLLHDDFTGFLQSGIGGELKLMGLGGTTQ